MAYRVQGFQYENSEREREREGRKSPRKQGDTESRPLGEAQPAPPALWASDCQGLGIVGGSGYL